MINERAKKPVSDDNLKFEWNEDSKGVNVPAKVTDAIVDLVSPFTSSFRQIANRIDLWGQRQSIEYIAETVRRSKEIAESEGIPITPKPPKLIAEWTRYVALEDDDILRDKWARLLLNSAERFRSRDVIFAGYLSRIGHAEALALDDLWQKTVWSERSPEITLLQELSGVSVSHPMPHQSYLSLIGVKLPNIPVEQPDWQQWNEIATEISSKLRDLGGFPSRVTIRKSVVHQVDSGGYGSPVGRSFSETSELQLAHDLQAIGIFDRFEFVIPKPFGVNPFEPDVEVIILAPSLMGVEFLRAVSAPISDVTHL